MQLFRPKKKNELKTIFRKCFYLTKGITCPRKKKIKKYNRNIVTIFSLNLAQMA